MSEELDDLDLARPRIADEQVVPVPHLGLDKLVSRDRPVHDVCLGQASPVLQSLEVVTSLGDQGNRDPLGNDPLAGAPLGDIRLMGAILFIGLTARVKGHMARSSLPRAGKISGGVRPSLATSL